MKQKIIPVIISWVCLTASAQTDSLPSYLRMAAENNPGVKAGFLTYQAALQKIPQAGAWQDPQLDMGFFLQPMEITDGKQVANIQWMQMFPWFGTRKAARTEAQHMAQMAFEQFRETRNQLFLDVYTQWFTLWRLQQQLLNTHENKDLLLQLEELALRRFASPVTNSGSGMASSPSLAAIGGTSAMSNGSPSAGMGSMGGATAAPSSAPDNSPMRSQGSLSSMGGGAGLSDVLRIRMEIVALENDIESLLSEIQAGKAQFNALLSRPADSEVVVPDTVRPVPFLLDKTAVLTEIKQKNPMLGMLNEEAAAYKAKADMDRKMSYPMFGIGLQYMLINKRMPDAATPMEMAAEGSNVGTPTAMNGKDMIMPMLSVSIPIYRGKYRAQQRETAFLQQASREKYANTLNLLEAELNRIGMELDHAARKIALYRKQSELAQAAYNLTVQEFASGKGDLTNVVQVQRELLDYRLKTAEAIAAHNTMVANIQKLIASNE